ncbi:MAG: hypothetical protein M3R49_10925 [Chloroflexota bacterium]|nr:hypothetical protein [Chloroflexota bacterium]
MTLPPEEGEEQVPVSVRLGTVVPPEDPEDWSRPLTWVAALGMLAGPLAALAWLVVERPTTSGSLLLGAVTIAVALVAGAVLTGSTQIGRSWAFAGTLGAGLFGALLSVLAGTLLAGERQLGVASPTLALSFLAAVAGTAGALAAALTAFGLADAARGWRRSLPSGAVGIGAAVIVARLLASH